MEGAGRKGLRPSMVAPQMVVVLHLTSVDIGFPSFDTAAHLHALLHVQGAASMSDVHIRWLNLLLVVLSLLTH